MSPKVLFVDDEPNVLDGIRRQLRKRVTLETAQSGNEGLQVIEESGPFAVVVSDMRMPLMNGAQFLTRVREISPDSVRMILSGQSDLENAVAAVNEGQIFRFLTKPCTNEQLWAAVEAGLEQYRLLTIERRLLDETLSGAVRTLTEVLRLTNSMVSNKATRIQHYAEELGKTIGIADEWQFRLASMLSQIGCIALPNETSNKLESGLTLSTEEEKIYQSHPKIAAKLLENIPRMGDVADMVAQQSRLYPEKSLPQDLAQWPLIDKGGAVLKAAAELDELIVQGNSHEQAIHSLCLSNPDLPNDLVEAIRGLADQAEEPRIAREVLLRELVSGMVLVEDVLTPSGVCLLTGGQEITETNLVRLQTVADGVGIKEPISVIEVRS